ncbi:MAG: tRNA (adenosine(37)-N6)-threonylcarbamoyltransferase complex ATPase subunit type 1 TsaE [Chlamydiota bacterium]
MTTQTYTTYSPQETIKLGETLGRQLPVNSMVCFFGDLAAGKTTLIKGLAAGAAGISHEQVNSPTFVYLNIYEGTKSLYHFDLYRLEDAEEFLTMGFDEHLLDDNICLIEWAEKIEAILPPNHIKVSIEHYDHNCRHITVES